MHNGPYVVATSQNYSNSNVLFALRCLPFNQLWCFGVASSNQYIISHEHSTNLSIQSNGNTTISGTLDVGKVLKSKRYQVAYDTIPLIITNSSSSGSGCVEKIVSTVKGCLFEYITSASSTSWRQGVLGSSNEFALKTGSNGQQSNQMAILF